MTRPVLITGALGYVGGRLSQFLADDGAITLRLGTRRAAEGRPAWLRSGSSVVALDLESDARLAAACAGIDTVIHLAAVNEVDSATDPEQALAVNGLGSLRLLHAAQRAGVRRFIFFSTAHVYGAPLHDVITERTVPRPVHPYAITHRVVEDFVLAAHDAGRVDGVVLRLSNGLGAPVMSSVNRWTLLANDLCRQAVTTRTLSLHSSGAQRRDFIPLEDVARATAHVLSLDRSALADGLFNLGGKNAMRVIDLARRIVERCRVTLGFAPEIHWPDPPPGCPNDDELDYRIDKLESTGFVLRGNVDEEIDATLKLCVTSFSHVHVGR